MTFVPNFKKLWKNEFPDANLLVPLLTWCSGYEKNIELCQRINKRFINGNKKILTHELALGNLLRHFIKYPKMEKENEKTKFFYDDMSKYFGWTPRELKKNLGVINIEEMKEIIARDFAYSSGERKVVGLKKLGGIKYGKKKTKLRWDA